jgi:hypothetical protein
MKTGFYRQQNAKIEINVKMCIFRLCETELILFLCMKQAYTLNFFCVSSENKK